MWPAVYFLTSRLARQQKRLPDYDLRASLGRNVAGVQSICQLPSVYLYTDGSYTDVQLNVRDGIWPKDVENSASMGICSGKSMTMLCRKVWILVP